MIDNIKPDAQKHTISLLVENRFGVLARIAGLFSARGYNIDSLSVGVTDDPNVSRMTIVVRGDNRILEQVQKQLNKLIDVIKVTDYVDTAHLERELIMVKVTADKSTRGELAQICDIFRAKIVDVAMDSLIIELTGDREKNEALLRMIRPFGIKEFCRTGIVAMARGKKGIVIPEMERALT
ncbi:acetolactate synthase small subunit [bacterium F11]|nr:acetolactate synthase small subunit [bacterium F11]